MHVKGVSSLSILKTKSIPQYFEDLYNFVNAGKGCQLSLYRFFSLGLVSVVKEILIKTR